MEWQILFIQAGVFLLLVMTLIILFRIHSVPSTGLNWSAFLRTHELNLLQAIQDPGPKTRWLALHRIIIELEMAQAWCKGTDRKLHFETETLLNQVKQKQREINLTT